MNSLELYEKKILLDEDFPLQTFENKIQYKGMIFKAHWHEHVEIHYITSGKGHVYCNQTLIEMSEGNLVLFNGNELHSGFSDSIPLNAVVIIFELKEFSKKFLEGNIIFHNFIKSDATLQDLCLKILDENVHKSESYELAIKGIVYQMIAYLTRNYTVMRLTDREHEKRIKNLSRLNTAIQYIQKHYAQPISNGQLAELVHLSESRFNHIFKESTGKSPLNFLNEVRLNTAMKLLRQPDDISIMEISSKVGFQDLNNFGRQFRKYYGVTPSKVREEQNNLTL